jgi:hypothetical protein
MERVTKHISFNHAKQLIVVQWNNKEWSFKKPHNADADGVSMNIANPSESAVVQAFDQWCKRQEHDFIKNSVYQILLPHVISGVELRQFLQDDQRVRHVKGKTGSFRRRIFGQTPL